MTIYKKIKNFGKKILLAGSLASILGGCVFNSRETPEYKKDKQLFGDLNGDNKPDLIDYSPILKDRFIEYYQINVSLNKKNGAFGNSKTILKIPSRYECDCKQKYGCKYSPSMIIGKHSYFGALNNLKLDDINNDNKKDLIYRIDFPSSFLTVSNKPSLLISAFGNGNGAFGKPRILKVMTK